MSYLPVSSHTGHEALAHSVLHAGHVLLDSSVGALVGPGCHSAASQRTQEVQEDCGVVNGGVASSCRVSAYYQTCETYLNACLAASSAHTSALLAKHIQEIGFCLRGGPYLLTLKYHTNDEAKV